MGWVWLWACGSEAAPGISHLGRDPQAMADVPAAAAGQEVAVFAGGCFWCLEADFDKLPGVVATTSGFAGGKEPNPTYDEVANHRTSHYEAVHVVFDPQVVPYEKLVDYFWRHVDPTDAGGQFCDRGDTYRTAIFPQTGSQEATARESLARWTQAGVLPGPIVTSILPNERFWPAEEYHQDFHQRNPERYGSYREGCGRDAKVKKVWSKAPPH